MLSWLWCWCKGSHSPFGLTQSQSAQTQASYMQDPPLTAQWLLIVFTAVRWGFLHSTFLRFQGFKTNINLLTAWIDVHSPKFHFSPVHKDLVFIVSFKNGLGFQKQLMKMPTVDDNTFLGHGKCSKCSYQVVTLDNCFLGILKGIGKCLASNFRWIYPWKSWHLTASSGELCHVWLFATPRTVAWQAYLYIGFFRQEYWSEYTIPFSRGSSPPRDQSWVSCIAGRFFIIWATREALFHLSWLLRRFFAF